MITFKFEASIGKELSNLIKSGKYEEQILNFLKQSKIVFRGSNFIHNKDQSHGECDFVDTISGEKYDAKLLIDTNSCREISTKLNIISWINGIRKDSYTFSNCCKMQNPDAIKRTQTYNLIEERLRKLKDNENAILFLPYPIGADALGGLLADCSTDLLDFIFDFIPNNLKRNRDIIVIYPMYNRGTAIRLLNKNIREHINKTIFDNAVNYSSSIVKIN